MCDLSNFTVKKLMRNRGGTRWSPDEEMTTFLYFCYSSRIFGHVLFTFKSYRLIFFGYNF
jgi:hypothetical protein